MDPYNIGPISRACPVSPDRRTPTSRRSSINLPAQSRRGAVFTLRPASALRSPGPDGGAWVQDVFALEVLANRFRLGGSSGLTRVGLRLRGDLRLQRPSMYHQCPSFA